MKRLITSDIIPNFLYHASPISDLKKIITNKSTHNKSWVYAIEDPIFALVFAGTKPYCYDKYVQSGYWNNKPFIKEMQPNAFKKAYFNGCSLCEHSPPKR